MIHTIIIQASLLAAALNAGGVCAGMAGVGGGVWAEWPVWGVCWCTEAVSFDAWRVRAAVAGCGVTRETFLPWNTAHAAATGTRSLLQLLHVQLQCITYIWLPVLLLLYKTCTYSLIFRIISLKRQNSVYFCCLLWIIWVPLVVFC